MAQFLIGTIRIIHGASLSSPQHRSSAVHCHPVKNYNPPTNVSLLPVLQFPFPMSRAPPRSLSHYSSRSDATSTQNLHDTCLTRPLVKFISPVKLLVVLWPSILLLLAFQSAPILNLGLFAWCPCSLFHCLLQRPIPSNPAPIFRADRMSPLLHADSFSLIPHSQSHTRHATIPTA